MRLTAHASRHLVSTLAAALLLSAPAMAADGKDGNLGQVRQGLVGGKIVSAQMQEKFTLVTLDTGCSGSLLRNEWVITAAHCVDSPDRRSRGRFVTVPDGSVTITAAWPSAQERRSVRVITFRPSDVAIIRVDRPFVVAGSDRGFIRDIFREGQFPYFGQQVPVPITAFGRGIHTFARGAGAGATPSQRDGQFRVGYFKTNRQESGAYWYPSTAGQHMAGGDSGGPSFAVVRGTDDVLMGVHSTCTIKCLPGMPCGQWPGPGPAPTGYSNWMWVTDTPECGDAPIAPVWDEITRHLGAFVAEAPPREPAFVGTFGKTPAGYQPMWLYAVKGDGELLWHRKNSGESPWQGPRKVGSGWDFKEVIAAGGNSVYALTNDGKLLWYRHDGFNEGSPNWSGRTEVGNGWRFRKIFAGGEGIVYAIKDDGEMLWYRHGNYAGGGAAGWVGPKSVGTGWGGFKDVFSTGQGQIYAVKPDGTLLLYQQIGWQTGERTWQPTRQVGSGWQGFEQIVAAGGGVIMVTTKDGKLLWYRHQGEAPVAIGLGRVKGPASGAAPSRSICEAARDARLRNSPAAPGLENQCRAAGGDIAFNAAAGNVTQQQEKWEGPVQIGSGWQGKRVFALLPVASAPVVR